MRPARMARLLLGGQLAERADFVIPRLVGSWAEGGVVWLAAIPGETVRTLIHQGRAPDPDMILDHLTRLWGGPVSPPVRSRSLAPGFHMIRNLLSHLLQDQESLHMLQRVVNILGPFVEAWRPTMLAHNDFYDDQVLLTSDTGRLALVDFEETGLGDPFLDVGTMLAHLHRSARFGAPETVDAYRHSFRLAALNRFGWDEQELDLREAYALFRLSANPFHQLRSDWLSAIEAGLAVANEVLDQQR